MLVLLEVLERVLVVRAGFERVLVEVDLIGIDWVMGGEGPLIVPVTFDHALGHSTFNTDPTTHPPAPSHQPPALTRYPTRNPPSPRTHRLRAWPEHDGEVVAAIRQRRGLAALEALAVPELMGWRNIAGLVRWSDVGWTVMDHARVATCGDVR